MALTYRQHRQLKLLADVEPGKAWLVSGHNRAACEHLVEKGLADRVGTDGGLCVAFSITDQGRELLAELETES